ncbi:YrrS family protein [Planococcus sp. YIM B11945]|uniref:YrrS family protein n=1 Tax=Planococcus sp. YIM B11945 TaxID=3435410 RepID=UPI003D7DF6BD
MSNEPQQRYPSRVKKKNRSNSILNMMIGLVFALIVITGAFIFLDNGNESGQQQETVQIATGDEAKAEETDSSQEKATEETAAEEEPAEDEPTAEETAKAEEAKAAEEAEKAEAEKAAKEAEAKEKEQAKKDKEKAVDKEGKVTGGTITREGSKDPVVEESVINTSWEPVKTKQTGDHVSDYNQGSVDWNEKISAITYATGLKESDMYVMRLENGGGPQKSVGVVKSKDESKKYRVHLEWVEGKGWKPVKMDILRTLEGAY